MPAWSEDEYVKRAAVIAQQSAVSKKPLNDVCEKVARDESLNPEEIRTVVRLSNVAMFQHLFKEKDMQKHADRHVEFDVADPEIVIMRLHQAAAAGPQSASVENDKLAFEVPDMMAAKRRGFELDNGTVKVASDHEVKPARTDMVVLTMRKLASEFESRRMQASFRWEQKIAALYDAFHKAPGYGPDFGAFEKDAYAEFGDNASLELESLRKDLRFAGRELPAEERAKLAEHHVSDETPALSLLKEALDARADYLSCEEAGAWVKTNMPSLGK